ncbi:MAG TPA: YceI family protein [Nannocystaceae bacterium]|nr:YceI family protein [Nannocystaceae bacterium]
MLRSIPMFMALAGILVLGCKSEIDNKPAAKVEEAKGDTKGDAKGDAKPAAAAITYKVDAAASSIGWVGAKVTGDHKGGFSAFSGEAALTDGKPTSISFVVDTTSVTSDDEKLTGHLKSPDFFDVEKFPKASFTSSAIAEKAGDGGVTHEISGELDLHGVKKAITFPAKLKVESTAASGEAEFTINRKDFGIVYAGMPDDLIKDEVLLKLSLRFAP